MAAGAEANHEAERAASALGRLLLRGGARSLSACGPRRRWGIRHGYEARDGLDSWRARELRDKAAHVSALLPYVPSNMWLGSRPSGSLSSAHLPLHETAHSCNQAIEQSGDQIAA